MISIKRFSLFIFTFLLITMSFFVNVQAASETTILSEFPDLDSEYIVLMDADSGEIIYENNANEKSYPASTTKLLTALLTVENASLDDNITYSAAAVNSIEYGDANASISIGETLTIEQSLYCLILRSANDVAYGLAEEIGGSISGFSDMMNEKLISLGATNSNFTNPSGLSDSLHYTTPYDMALIAQACFNNKTLMEIIGYESIYTIPPTNKSTFTRYYKHRYQMVAGGEYAYDYSLGGKTGFTYEAGSCLVSFAEKDGLKLICVILNSTDDARYTDTISLFDYYFDNYNKVYFDDSNLSLSTSTLDVLNLTTSFESTNVTSISFSKDAYLLIPKDVSFQDLTSIVTYSENPAYSGDENGFACISYFYNDVTVGSATIFINESETSSVLPGTNGVPLLNSFDTKIIRPTIKFINIWIIIGISLSILIFIFIIFLLVKKNLKRHHYGSKRLHF